MSEKPNRPAEPKWCRLFTKNTPVKTESGCRNIQNLEIGDVVLSFNEETKKNEYKKVKQLFTKTVAKLLRVIAGTDTLLCTPEHKFYSAGKWLRASALGLGMTLQLSDGTQAAVNSNITIDTNAAVYNFEVEQNHNYYVGRQSILAHNNCEKIAELVESGKLLQDDVAEFAKDFAGNNTLLNQFVSGELEVDAWKAMYESGIDELLRRDPDAIKTFSASSSEGLDPVDGINDAVQMSGKSKLTWPEIKALFKRGNDFNRKARIKYGDRYSEIVLQGLNNKAGKRLDTYIPPKNEELGQIISRKATDIDNITEQTWRNYCNEVISKYKVGTPINSTKLPGEPPLSGKYYLEIPLSNQAAQKLESFKTIAKEYGTENFGGIEIIFLAE